MLPRLFESPDICARVSATSGSGNRPRRQGTPIVAGAGDQAAGAVGMGITRPGAVSVTIGTSGVVFAATDRPALDPEGRLHTFCHAIPDRWHVMGVTQAAGLSLRWMREQLGLKEHGDAGIRDDDARSRGDRAGRGRRAVGAVLDGRAHAASRSRRARRARRSRRESHARSHRRARCSKGWRSACATRSRFSTSSACRFSAFASEAAAHGRRCGDEIQADVYGHAVETVDADEGAAYGAALLAGVGAGVWPSVDEACDRLVRSSVAASPDPARVAVMNERYAAYRAHLPCASRDCG